MTIRKSKRKNVFLSLVAAPARSLTTKSIDADPASTLLTIADVATLLALSAPTVRRLQQRRMIPYVKIGGSIRFMRSDIASYLEERRVPSIG